MTAGLLVVAHGSRSGSSQAVARALTAAATFALGSIPAVAAFLDHDSATPAAGIDALAERGADYAVVVPLFLGAAFHVYEDLPAQLGSALPCSITEHLGADPLIIEALADRIGDAVPKSVVLAAAGTSDLGSQAETHAAARALGEKLGIPCSAAFLSSALPTVESVLSDGPMLVPYLLAEGHFSSQLHEIAEEHELRCAPVIGAHPALARLIAHRYQPHA